MELSWLVFGTVVLVALFLDLFVFHRHPHKISIKESLWLSAFWIALGLAFAGFVYYTRGYDRTVEYLTGYLLEKSLSLDNIFVFILIFSYFKIPEVYTTNGSLDTAIIAGTESMANIISEISTKRRARNIGVA